MIKETIFKDSYQSSDQKFKRLLTKNTNNDKWK